MVWYSSCNRNHSRFWDLVFDIQRSICLVRNTSSNFTAKDLHLPSTWPHPSWKVFWNVCAHWTNNPVAGIADTVEALWPENCQCTLSNHQHLVTILYCAAPALGISILLRSVHNGGVNLNSACIKILRALALLSYAIQDGLFIMHPDCRLTQPNPLFSRSAAMSFNVRWKSPTLPDASSMYVQEQLATPIDGTLHITATSKCITASVVASTSVLHDTVVFVVFLLIKWDKPPEQGAETFSLSGKKYMFDIHLTARQLAWAFMACQTSKSLKLFSAAARAGCSPTFLESTAYIPLQQLFLVNWTFCPLSQRPAS